MEEGDLENQVPDEMWYAQDGDAPRTPRNAAPVARTVDDDGDEDGADFCGNVFIVVVLLALYTSLYVHLQLGIPVVL